MTTAKTRTLSEGRDAELLRLEADCRALEAGMADADQDGRDALTDRAEAIRWRIAHLRAHTPAGMAAKARLLLEAVLTGEAGWSEPLARGLLADLERQERKQA